MRRRTPLDAALAVLVLTAAALVACGDDDDPGTGGADGSGGDSTSSTSSASAVTSSGTTTATASSSAGGDGGEGGGAGGTGGEGGGATARQLEQVATLERYVDETCDQTAWHQPIDREALKEAGRDAILAGDGSDTAFFQAMHLAHLAMPQGHQTLALTAPCTSPDMFLQNWSRFGVCGRPRGDTIVVTTATPDNALGLAPGDVVVRAGDDEGAALLEAAIERPSCGSPAVTDSGLREGAAATFFGTVPAGMALVVEPADGSQTREVVVPEGGEEYVSCQDPLGRDIDFDADAYVRDDGVAVLRLPRFFPFGVDFPDNPTQEEIDEILADFRANIVAAFDTVRDEPYLVIDARSNYGGFTLIGLEIANGMPTASATSISHCLYRLPGSDPPAFDDDPYAIYEIEPGGPFAYDGEVVVLVDGLDYSAADYFPYAVRKATSTPIVGTAHAGAYGGPGAAVGLDGPPEMIFNVDVNKCVDADSLEPLEGTAIVPDLVVEYDPADLAAGVDTVLEAAAELVLGD